MKRKLTVTVTTIRRQTVGPGGAVLRVRCPVCGREVEALSRAQAEELLTIAGRSLDDLMASSQAHAIRTIGDGLRVCKDSLCAS